MSFSPTGALGYFLPTYQDFSFEDPAVMNSVMAKMYTDVANAVNIKINGQHELTETLTCQTYYTTGDNQTKKYVFRKCFTLGAITHGTTATIPHGITPIGSFTRISGVALTAPTDWRPIPYVGIAANDFISILVRAGNILITVGNAHPDVISGRVVLEYLKN